jgi:hypothetical protein
MLNRKYCQKKFKIIFCFRKFAERSSSTKYEQIIKVWSEDCSKILDKR